MFVHAFVHVKIIITILNLPYNLLLKTLKICQKLIFLE